MFDIGFLELIIVAVVGLLVLGPERLPIAIKTTMVWVSRIKRSFVGIREEIERELNVDEIRRDIHNSAVMDELKRTREELEQGVSEMRKSVHIDLNQPLFDDQDATETIKPERVNEQDKQAATPTDPSAVPAGRSSNDG